MTAKKKLRFESEKKQPKKANDDDDENQVRS
jgi:hypothetical protein